MFTAPRRYLLVVLPALIAAGCTDSIESPIGPEGDPDFSRVTPGASFDWSVPARFGVNRTADGLIAYPRTAKEINPSSWTVNFDACDLATDAHRYNWTIDRKRVASVSTCEYSHEFDVLGTYDVTLHIVPTRGPVTWVEEAVTVQDWLILSVGDSYASGEGVPEVEQEVERIIRELDAAMFQFAEADRQLKEAIEKLRQAIDFRDAREEIRDRRRERRNNLVDACHPDNWGSGSCLEFASDGDTYNTALENLNTALDAAQQALNDAIDAYHLAVAARDSAQQAVDGLTSVVHTLQKDLPPARWQERYDMEEWGEHQECNRSAWAAPALAALALEQSDPRTSVTFVHLACSGAQMVADGDDATIEDQLRWANEIIGEREIDGVLVSIGGNDAGFAHIAMACMVQADCSDTPAADRTGVFALCSLMGVLGFEDDCLVRFDDTLDGLGATAYLAEGLAGLPGRYDRLGNDFLPVLAGLHGAEMPARMRSERVYITEYVDMTKDHQLSYCALDFTNLLGSLPGISGTESEWLDRTAARGVNAAVASAAGAHGWNLVDGVYNAYQRQGYCSNEHWVVRMHETFIRQGNYYGMLHPNRSGQVLTSTRILSAMWTHLYPEGDGRPRAPDQPSVRGAVAGSLN